MPGPHKAPLPTVPTAPCDGCQARQLCTTGFTCLAYRTYVEKDVQLPGYSIYLLGFRGLDFRAFNPLTD